MTALDIMSKTLDASCPRLSRASTSFFFKQDVDGRDKCLVRGHDRLLFGDITDTLLIGQVDFGNLVSGEEDAVLAVCRERSDGDALATEGLRHLPVPCFEADVVLGCGDRANDLTLIVFH